MLMVPVTFASFKSGLRSHVDFFESDTRIEQYDTEMVSSDGRGIKEFPAFALAAIYTASSMKHRRQWHLYYRYVFVAAEQCIKSSILDTGRMFHETLSRI